MRMRFTGEDEGAYVRARDELVERFAAWGRRRGVPAAPADVELLLDLRYEHGDGVLDDWTIGDVEEFLLEWCPQVLSAASDDVDGLPGSVAAWVQFLAEEGLLADRSDAPERIREYCAGVAVLFRAALADRDVEAVELPASIGPLRMPRPDEIAESIHAGQALRMARALALFCAAPGRKLTPKGNLRVADARELVTVLDTGDDVERAGYAAVRSVAELPGVWTWVRIGLAAGAVRRQNGRLVAVARFTKLDDIAAHDALVRAAFAGSLPIDDGDVLATAVGAATDHLLAMLLDGPADGVMAIHAVGSVVAAALEVRAGIVDELVPGIFERIVDLLTGVDLVTVGTRLCPDCPDPHPVFDLTAAGAPHAVERVRAAGVEVTVLPEPAEASAAELVAGVEAAGPGFTADVAAWLSVQQDADAAVDELGAAIVAADPVRVMLALTLLTDLPGLPEAVHRRREGVHEGLLLPWLIEHGQIDGATVEPARLVRASVDVAAVLVDVGGVDDAVDMVTGPEPLTVLRDIWRIDHPRLAEVLELVAQRHPDEAVAKEARRSLMKLRSRAI